MADLNLVDIARRRLDNQRISRQSHTSPEDVAAWMTAIQAQDYNASLWGVGLRMMQDSSQQQIEQAISEARIIRTWPMRGTIHLVAAPDVRWLLKLLTPKVIRGSAGRYKELGLDEETFVRSRTLAEEHLLRAQVLTRAELYAIWESHGIAVESQRGYHIVAHLAQTGVICFGPKQDKHETFVLLDEWVPQSTDLRGDEALAELALRYISARGPATDYDFAFWSGLNLTDVRKALHLAGNRLFSVSFEGQNYWLTAAENELPASDEVCLLPAFDEILCGYKDRSAVLPTSLSKSVILKNGIFKPIILAGAQTAGSWKRVFRKTGIDIEFQLFRELTNGQELQLRQLAEKYAAFLGQPLHEIIHKEHPEPGS